MARVQFSAGTRITTIRMTLGSTQSVDTRVSLPRDIPAEHGALSPCIPCTFMATQLGKGITLLNFIPCYYIKSVSLHYAQVFKSAWFLPIVVWIFSCHLQELGI